jgi:protease-4
MKKNPLLVLLGVSFTFFLVFMGFVYFMLQSFVSDSDSPLAGLKRGGNIGVVELDGVIMDSKKFIRELRKFEKDRSIQGIIVRIDSPGGAVGPSQEIHDAILQTKKTKPVVASMESVAASGGYYAAVAADRIIANAGTMTGSIGVIMNFMNLSQLYEWAKLKRYVIKSGKFKDLGSDLRDMNPEERQILQDMIDNVHMQFMTAVSKGRRLPLNKVREAATGQIFSGEQAFQLKLVDQLGGIEVAKNAVRELAKMEGEAELVYPRPKRESLMESLGSPFSSQFANAILSQLGVQEGSQPLRDLSLPRGPLYLAPGF